MQRVLQVVDSMDMGGIQTFIMNVYRHIDRSTIQFDFLVFRDNKQTFEGEILQLGGKIYKLPGRHDGLLKNKKAIKNFFDEHQRYKIIHYHTSSLSDIGIIKEAYRRKIPIRIIHSHSTHVSGNKIHLYMHKIHKKSIGKLANHYLACGELAGKWFYKGTEVENKVVIVNNGIDCNEYKFSEEKRIRMRKELKIENNFVIGHVGRFSEVKNHRFILQVFARLIEKYPEKKPKLILIGNGILFDEIKQLAQKLNIINDILFLGIRHDVSEILQAMDVMIMPSLYEGFPVTALEAQAAGLPCVLSDTITKAVVIKENVVMRSLLDSWEEWADELVGMKERMPDNDLLFISGFDINVTVQQLMKVYLNKDVNKC